MVARNFSMYSLSDLGITAGNYNFSTLATGGTFTASGTAAPTPVVLDDTDSQDSIFNDGAPGSAAAAPTSQLLTGTVDGTVFSGVPSNPENEFEVTDSLGNVVGFIYDLHDANSSAFSSLQGYVTTFDIVPGETYSVVRTSTVPNTNYSSFITCFTHNTLITTADGRRPIQELSCGDEILTMDHGLQRIRWIGSSAVEGKGKFAPIRISKGALGNTRAMLVSPQHRMLLTGWRAEILFGQDQVLIAAKDLVNDSTIYREERSFVRYMHMLFDQHEVVYAEDSPSESFLATQVSLSAQGSEARAEILSLFPQLTLNKQGGVDAARPLVKSSEAGALKL